MRKFYLSKVFVEWRENPTDEFQLSLIPLHAYISGLVHRFLGTDPNFEFSWVPPWKITVKEG